MHKHVNFADYLSAKIKQIISVIFYQNCNSCDIQRWSRRHKARGQGQGQLFRGQTLSRTEILEAKDQGKQAASVLKKKRSKKIFFSGDLHKTRSSKKFFSGDLQKNVFKKFFQTIYKKMSFKKFLLGDLQKSNNSKK